MKLHEREALLERLQSGDVPLAAAFDVERADLDAIAKVGAAALAGGRHALAEKVFAGLFALAPDEPVHALHLACARAAGGDTDGALAALDDVLARPASPRALRGDDEVEALLLRAELRGRVDPSAALADLGRARALQGAKGAR